MIYRLVTLLLLAAATAFASGSVDVMDPITKLGKKIKGGDGIDITAGVITNTASRVPITSSTGVILFSSTGCAAGWQTTMATEIAQYAAVGIQPDHIVCYPYTPPAGGASFTFPPVAATGVAGSVATAYTADAGFSFPAVSGTGVVGTFTAAAGATGDAIFTFPSVSGGGAAGVMTASYAQDGAFTFPAVTATGAVGTLTVAGGGSSATTTDFETNLNDSVGGAWTVLTSAGGDTLSPNTGAVRSTSSPISGTGSLKATAGISHWSEDGLNYQDGLVLVKQYALSAGSLSFKYKIPPGAPFKVTIENSLATAAGHWSATDITPAGIVKDNTVRTATVTVSAATKYLAFCFGDQTVQSDTEYISYIDDISVP